MTRRRCNRCVGSGTVMGGGMILEDCPNCDGTGKIYEDLMKKESNEYKNAKSKIKSLDDNMTEQEAEKLLDEELEKQSNVARIGKKESRKTN